MTTLMVFTIQYTWNNRSLLILLKPVEFQRREKWYTDSFWKVISVLRYPSIIVNRIIHGKGTGVHVFALIFF